MATRQDPVQATAQQRAAAPRELTLQDVAVLNVQGRLLSVSSRGTKTFVQSGAVWCATDNKAGVIWYTTDDELRYLDVEGGSSHLVAGGIGAARIIIDHGEGERIGGYDEVTPDVALHVLLTGEPTLSAKVLCEGDAWHYCYQDNGDDNIDNDPLIVELETKRARYDALTLSDPSALAALHLRGRSRALWTPAPKADAPIEVKVPASGCEEVLADCGDAEPLPTTPPLWAVVVGNGRGDYYHEARQFYDPSSEQFFLPDDPADRRPSPLPDEQGVGIEGLLIAPSGKGYLWRGLLATWTQVLLRSDASACGFIGPMYRVPGPRG